MSLSRFYFVVVLHIFLLIPGGVLFASNALQVSPTVTLDGGNEVSEGVVVVSDEEHDSYQISTIASQGSVFGVTAVKPALVFSTGIDQVPVVTEGVALVQVDGSNGSIQRGDLLVTSEVKGVATRAGEFNENVFAIALEAFEGGGLQEFGLIHAEIGTDRARAVQAAQGGSVSGGEDGEVKTLTPSIVRGTVAVILVIGALFFVLYSFRSTMAQGVISVGRNPKARRSIVTLSFANIAFALLLCVIVIFIAIAILILPLR